MVPRPAHNSGEKIPGEVSTSRYRGVPVVFMRTQAGSVEPCPYLMTRDELIAFLRLHESRTRFPKSTVARYRRLGLRTVRVGRRVWYALPDVLDFIDGQQERLTAKQIHQDSPARKTIGSEPTPPFP